MDIALNIFLLIIGFVLLIKGADFFVDACSNIARKLRVPSVVIGLTIVALGTSIPEAVVSISAALRGANGMAVGNAVGSNLFNLLMVIGLCAAIKPITVNFKEISKDYWVSVTAAVVYLFLLFVFSGISPRFADNVIPRFISVIIFIVFIFYIIVLVRHAIKNRASQENEDSVSLKPIWHSVLFSLLGVSGIITGGQLSVTGAIEIAKFFGMTERVIGLTVIAIGTSLPELVTGIIALKKKESAIAIGNVIGSNIFNLLFVLGLSGAVFPLAVDVNFIIDFSLLLIVSFLFFLFVHTRKRVSRFEGTLFVLIYITYTAYALII